mgnify:CR=1 FL=1
MKCDYEGCRLSARIAAAIIYHLANIFHLATSGLSNDDAIVAGLRSNGAIITTAGAIMALAFSGLLASSTLVVHEVCDFCALIPISPLCPVRGVESP